MNCCLQILTQITRANAHMQSTTATPQLPCTRPTPATAHHGLATKGVFSFAGLKKDRSSALPNPIPDHYTQPLNPQVMHGGLPWPESLLVSS